MYEDDWKVEETRMIVSMDGRERGRCVHTYRTYGIDETY